MRGHDADPAIELHAMFVPKAAHPLDPNDAMENKNSTTANSTTIIICKMKIGYPIAGIIYLAKRYCVPLQPDVVFRSRGFSFLAVFGKFLGIKLPD